PGRAVVPLPVRTRRGGGIAQERVSNPCFFLPRLSFTGAPPTSITSIGSLTASPLSLTAPSPILRRASPFDAAKPSPVSAWTTPILPSGTCSVGKYPPAAPSSHVH